MGSNSAIFGKRDATAFVDANNQRPTRTIVAFVHPLHSGKPRLQS
jgi:hypothetical protein